MSYIKKKKKNLQDPQPGAYNGLCNKYLWNAYLKS